jgi:hypothetical protein
MVKMTRGGEEVQLNDVDQGACPRCGGRVYRVQILERVESAMHGDAVDALLYRLDDSQDATSTADS